MESKKSSSADLEKKRTTFLQIGLVVSLLTLLIAFEWKSSDEDSFLKFHSLLEDIPEEIIPITRQQEAPPPPPPPPVKQLVIVKDDAVIENENVPVAETEINEETIIEPQSVQEKIVDEPEIFITAEQMPYFPGGEAKMFEYLSSHIKYPGTALENGVTGTVFLSFVIGVDGAVTKVNLLKGIGSGCDDEAIRVVLSMPKWIPGKQRNKPVPVQYSLPVQFRMR